MTVSGGMVVNYPGLVFVPVGMAGLGHEQHHKLI